MYEVTYQGQGYSTNFILTNKVGFYRDKINSLKVCDIGTTSAAPEVTKESVQLPPLVLTSC